MKIEEAIELAVSAERIPVEAAHEILGYGITEFLDKGLKYPDIVDMIARAEVAINRESAQKVSFGSEV